jgi:hypothetical protein
MSVRVRPYTPVKAAHASVGRKLLELQRVVAGHDTVGRARKLNHALLVL